MNSNSGSKAVGLVDLQEYLSLFLQDSEKGHLFPDFAWPILEKGRCYYRPYSSTLAIYGHRTVLRSRSVCVCVCVFVCVYTTPPPPLLFTSPHLSLSLCSHPALLRSSHREGSIQVCFFACPETSFKVSKRTPKKKLKGRPTDSGGGGTNILLPIRTRQLFELNTINLLEPSGHISARSAKILILIYEKKKNPIGKRRVYESVDDESLS